MKTIKYRIADKLTDELFLEGEKTFVKTTDLNRFVKRLYDFKMNLAFRGLASRPKKGGYLGLYKEDRRPYSFHKGQALTALGAEGAENNKYSLKINIS